MRTNAPFRPGAAAGVKRGASPAVLVLFILLLVGGNTVALMTFSLTWHMIAANQRR